MSDSPRLRQLRLLQQTFPTFVPFMVVVMTFLGFPATAIQKDIANFLEFGPKDLMVQAQRSQAKSTITAIFAVWCLIHHPRWSVLIVSAGGKMANEISTLICRIILNMPILACMRPDKTAGDKVSVEAFDIHNELKGTQKSPSIACTGITGNMQGKRANLLIADDIESSKNSRTAQMRELLLHLMRDFASIVQTGRIIYLGTPQTDASVYNTLPQSGFAVRIWPGRYPTGDQIEAYGNNLAPYILTRLEENPALASGGGPAGDQGQPVDPELLGEESLSAKELKQGTAYFQLQHMLSTKLTDEMRYPLKPINLVVMRLADRLPVAVTRGMSHENRREYQVGSVRFSCSTPQYVSPETALPSGRVMKVDPAGGGKNGDETAYAIVDQLNGNIFVRAVGAVPGGYDEANLRRLAKVAARWQPDVVNVEKNLGHGAFTQVLLPYLRSEGVKAKTVDVFEGGQKELRIVETLEPVMGRGSLIIDEDVILTDWDSTTHHPMDKRQLFTLFFQMTKLTRDRGSLVKDDRLDALAGAVAHWIGALGQDALHAEKRIRDAQYAEWTRDPMDKNRYQAPGTSLGGFHSTLRKRR